MQSHCPRALSIGIVIGHEHPAFGGGYRLGGVERERSEVTNCSRIYPFVLARQRMRRILYNANMMPPRDLHQVIHFRRMAAEVYRDDGTSPRGYGVFHGGWIQTQSVRIDIDENRHSAAETCYFGGGGEGESWDDHFVTCRVTMHPLAR
jgi:hypothetical protein